MSFKLGHNRLPTSFKVKRGFAFSVHILRWLKETFP